GNRSFVTLIESWRNSLEPQPSLSREPRQKRPQHRHDEHVGSRERPKARLYRYAESRNDNGELAACNEFHARPETPMWSMPARRAAQYPVSTFVRVVTAPNPTAN